MDDMRQRILESRKFNQDLIDFFKDFLAKL